MRLWELYWHARPALSAWRLRPLRKWLAIRAICTRRLSIRASIALTPMAPGYEGPLGPVGVLAAPVTAPFAMLTGGFPGGGGCGVTQDFNGRYTAVCGL
jgi:hypothetical protein